MIADGTSPLPSTFGDKPQADDLMTVRQEFGLGEIQGATFLAEGLMNRNWRLDTVTGAYALKLLCDVPAEIARRNALVLGALASAGLPVCAPLATRDGVAVLEIGSRYYLLSPWAQGAHIEGVDLPVGEVADFGALVAGLHQA